MFNWDSYTHKKMIAQIIGKIKTKMEKINETRK